MNQQKKALFILSSRILSYPDERFPIKEMKELIREAVESEKLKEDLLAACNEFKQLSSQELQELYVQTFDLKSKSGLYLTAHELGDSNKRGAALIKLQKMINQAGFERQEGELADYLPMLFEFLAVAKDTEEKTRLYKRLSIVIHRIAGSVDEENPYYNILRVLVEHLFVKPTEEEMKVLENQREEADLEELPYPIMYQ